MSPVNQFGDKFVGVPIHSHVDGSQGGQLDRTALLAQFLAALALLDRTTAQTFLSALIIPGASITAALDVASLATTPIQSVINGFICLLGSEVVSNGRTWNLPDLASLTALLLAASPYDSGIKHAGFAATTIWTPPAGLYRLHGRLIVTTSSAAGSLTPSIGWTDENGAELESALASALVVTAQGQATFQSKCFRVSSGDVKLTMTETVPITGTPNYRAEMALVRLSA